MTLTQSSCLRSFKIGLRELFIDVKKEKVTIIIIEYLNVFLNPSFNMVVIISFLENTMKLFYGVLGGSRVKVPMEKGSDIF